MSVVQETEAYSASSPGSMTMAARFKRLRADLRARPDSEHEVAINRIVITSLVLLYWTFTSLLGGESAQASLSVAGPGLVVYAISTLLLFAHLLRYPDVSHFRRCIALLLDFGFLSAGIYLGGDTTAFLYSIYLWVILGNGFRYGLEYLAGSAFIGVLCFSVAAFMTPYWREHTALCIGLALSLVILPAYSATLIRKLSAAKLAAESASRAKTMFLASVSHELRTPLNAIVGLSDLLCDTSLEAEQEEMVRTIGRSGRSLASLINSILDVSRMEIGKLPVKTEEVDLLVVLHDIREMLAVQAQAKSVRVTIQTAANTPRHVTINLCHLQEILVNLGGNAVKFTREGFVLIEVAPISDANGRIVLRFEVRDTGIGIAESARGRIFERFAQADETIIDQYGGTGLGLSIVKQLVEGAGGRIGVESVEGAGSTFWFEMECGRMEQASVEKSTRPVILLSQDRSLRETYSQICDQLTCFDFHDAQVMQWVGSGDRAARPILVLDEQSLGPNFEFASTWFAQKIPGKQWPAIWLRDPARVAEDASVAEQFAVVLQRSASAEEITTALSMADALCFGESAPPPEKSASAVGLDILVAEDNKTNQLVIRKILETAGHRVIIADNGEQAIEHLGAGKFDLVMMDINMPVLNGIEAAKLARFIEMDVDPVPIVALTADATEETRAKCLEAGMNDCLTKPIDRPKLLAWLDAFQSQLRNRKSKEVAADAEFETDAECEKDDGAAASAPVIDRRALGDLEALGGKEFVDQIVDQFVQDAACVLKELSQAVSVGDAHAFREQAHALRSCAANVGARQVYDLCLSWRAIDASEVAIRGEEHMRKLELEFERTCAALGK